MNIRNLFWLFKGSGSKEFADQVVQNKTILAVLIVVGIFLIYAVVFAMIWVMGIIEKKFF
jgi:hypothetical protein